MDLVKVGKLIAKLRKEKHMTQEELAYKFDITGKSVSKWERGINAPDIAILEPLSKELGISINELLSGEIDVNKNSKNDKAILSFCFTKAHTAKEIAEHLGINASTYFRKEVLEVLVKKGFLIENNAGKSSVFLSNREKVFPV